MLGYYDYTVVLTYVSLVISIVGITNAIQGNFRIAILCLAVSGLCDMFDGKIARTKKNRTEEEKRFGIQIDSLCDVICFGVHRTEYSDRHRSHFDVRGRFRDPAGLF